MGTASDGEGAGPMLGVRVSTWQLIRAGAVGVVVFGTGVVEVSSAARAASTITVNTVADDMTVNGNCTLREALLAADTDAKVDKCAAGSGADTINVPAGTITLKLGELTSKSNVTVKGAGSTTVIAGAGKAIRGMHVLSGGNVVLSKLAITKTYTAVRNDARVTLNNVNVVANSYDPWVADTAKFPAVGLDNRGTATATSTLFKGNGDLVGYAPAVTITNKVGASLTLSNSTVRDAVGSEPAIDNEGTLSITHTLFDRASTTDDEEGNEVRNEGTANISYVTFTNSSGNGADDAIENDGTLTADHIVIAKESGGFQNSGTLSLTDSTIRDNIFGFAIDNYQGATLQIATTTISGNQSDYDPVLHNYGTAIFVNVTIDGNQSDNQDGLTETAAIHNHQGGTFLGRNLTVTGNTLTENGTTGGIYNETGATLRLANSVVAGNTYNDGAHGHSGDCSGAITSLGYNLIQVKPSSCTLMGTLSGNQIGVNPKLGPLANNGGYTETRMPQPASPAIDKGNPSAPGTSAALCPLFDQRGITRPQDGNADGTKRCDIGSVEKDNNRYVSVSWSDAESARIDQMSAFLGTTPAAVQKTSVYLISYLVSLGTQTPTPITLPAPGNAVTYTDTWTPKEFPVLDRVKHKYALDDSDATRFSTQLVNYLLAVGGH